MSRWILLEVLVIFFAAIYCLLWVFNPQGNFEPVVALCAIIGSGFDLWRRNSSQSQVQVSPGPIEQSKPVEKTRPIRTTETLPTFCHTSSCAFFAERFAQAFPGIRAGEWFEGYSAIERLKILLEQPLKYSRPDDGWIEPVGWQRNGNMPFSDFELLSKDTVLIDSKEIKVRKIYAGYMSNYKQLFVYLEADAMPAVGVYEHTQSSLEESKECFGYAYEEYGLYKGAHPVTRAEYDDDAALIMGKPVKLHGDVKIRIRFLSSYNMVISATGSCLNQTIFDEKLRAFMDRMLAGDNCMPEFEEEVRKLPSSPAL